MTTESISELDSLAGAAAAADQGAATADTPPGAEPEPQGPDYAHEAAGAVDMFAALVVGYCPPAESIWTNQKKAQVASALAPVMEKYGVTLGNLPPELVLAIMAGPPLVATIKVMAKQRTEEGKTEPAQPAQPDQQQTAAQPPAPDAQEGPGVHPQIALYRRNG